MQSAQGRVISVGMTPSDRTGIGCNTLALPPTSRFSKSSASGKVKGRDARQA